MVTECVQEVGEKVYRRNGKGNRPIYELVFFAAPLLFTFERLLN